MKETKTCFVCNNTLAINNFPIGRNKCKPCVNEYARNKYNPLKKQTYYESNKENYKTYNASKEVKQRRNSRNKVRRKEDTAFRIMTSQRARIHEVLKGYKNCKSGKLLNCTREQIKIWLTFLMEDWMSWENFGTEWHIDHVVPVSFFNIIDSNEQKYAFHWSNLRPLRKETNISKFNKIVDTYIQKHIEDFNRFQKTYSNNGYQVSTERCLWRRLEELRDGKNPKDTVCMMDTLKWAIRSQAPTSVNDKDKETVQRLNGNGLETTNHCQ
jgi:hypothetical protein